MVDLSEMTNTAMRLRSRASEIRRIAKLIDYPTADLDAGLLERAAELLDAATRELTAAA